MKTYSKTVTIEAVEILGFGKKGNAILSKGKTPLVAELSNTFVSTHNPRVGDFLVRDKGARAWSGVKTKSQINEFKEVKAKEDTK